MRLTQSDIDLQLSAIQGLQLRLGQGKVVVVCVPEDLHTSIEDLYISLSHSRTLLDAFLSIRRQWRGALGGWFTIELTLSITLYALRMISMSLTNMRASFSP